MDAVPKESTPWQNQPRDDAPGHRLHRRCAGEGAAIILRVPSGGTKEIGGIWICEREGAGLCLEKFAEIVFLITL